jgi:hypothetical protein
VDRAAYRAEAEAFLAELNSAYREHFAGLRPDLPLEEVYDAHPGLFDRAAVDALAGEPELRRFAIEGFIGARTRDAEAALAAREAALRIDVDGQRLGFREAAVVQAGEADADRRARIEAARDEATESELSPLARAAVEASHAAARELGWPHERAMWTELDGLDLEALGREAEEFLAATDDAYAELLDGELRRITGRGLEDARRSDLPRFFRAPEFDPLFPAEGLVPSLTGTLAGMGIGLDARPNVSLDVESRALKSPRAFCAPVGVPHEVHLVVAPIGGADDHRALFHEAGHALHFGGVDPGAAFERRCLGDNTQTEAYAFLFEHIVEDPGWLARRGARDRDAHRLRRHARAHRLLKARRYCAKLLYELELHAADGLEGLDAVYARRLSDALHVPWPPTTWLTDLDPGFYAARYLRAWALETRLRATLRDEAGDAWWDDPRAGALLAERWREGQPRMAEATPLFELVVDLTGYEAVPAGAA